MKHVFRLRSLLLLIVVLGVCMACARTLRYVSYCKTRVREHSEALAVCRAAERLWLIEEPARIRASHAAYYRDHKATSYRSSKQRIAIFEMERSRPDIDEETRQQLAQDVEAEKEEEAEWERDWRKEGIEGEATVRELIADGKIAQEWANYHARLKAKYEAAANRPWKWFPPDEPAPSTPISDLLE